MEQTGLIHLIKSEEIETEPLETDSGRLSLVDVVSQAQGAPISAGIAEIWPPEQVEFDYDNDCAACFMIDGEVHLTEGGKRHDLQAGDVVFIPQQEGLRVLWGTESYGRFFYVTYPHWR